MLRMTVLRGSEKMGGVPSLKDSGVGTLELASTLHPPASGDWDLKFVTQARGLLHELTSPLSVATFASGIFAARVAAATFLTGATAWGWGTALSLQAVGLGTEIATMTVARRLGAQLFFGAQDQWKPGEVAQEMLLMAGPFGLLRGSHQLFAKLSPILESGLTPGLRRVMIPTAQLSGDVLAMMGGHGLNRAMKWEQPSAGESSLFYSGLLGVAHMRLAGMTVAPFTFRSLDRLIQVQEQRLRAAAAKLPEVDRGDGTFPSAVVLESVAIGGGAPRELWDLHHHMKAQEGVEGTPQKTGDSQPPPSSDRGAAIRSEVESRLTDLQREAAQSTGDEHMQAAAQGLLGLLQRYQFDPESVRDKSFENGLSEVKEHLDQAEASGNTLLEGLRSIRGLIEQVRPRGDLVSNKGDATTTPVAVRSPMVADPPPASMGSIIFRILGEAVIGTRDEIKGLWGRIRRQEPPKKPADQTPIPEGDVSSDVKAFLEEVGRQVEAKEQLGNQFQQALQNLKALRLYLNVARKFGLREWAKEALNVRLVKLKGLFPNIRWEPRSWSQATGTLADRRNGILLGLGIRTPNMKLDTTLARRLRGETVHMVQSKESELDPDLEALQHCLLLGAGWRGSSAKMANILDRLIKDYGINYRSATAAKLAAEAAYQSVVGKISGNKIMDHLGEKTKGGPLEGALISLQGAVNSNLDLPNSMFNFTRVGNVENYFFSALGVVLRSSGEPNRFLENLRKMDEVAANGFHPTVAMGLYSAIYGFKTLPTQHFLPIDFDSRGFLNRAQEEFHQTTSDMVVSR